MHKISRILSALMLVTLAASVSATGSAQSSDGSLTTVALGQLSGGVRYEIPAWFKDSFLDIAEDAAEAQAQNKHVLLYMHLNECPYCGHMLTESFRESDFAKWIPTRFDSIAINIRGAREIAFNQNLIVTERELAQALKVQYTPTIVFLDGNNQQVSRTNGYRSANEFKDILDFVDSKAYQYSQLNDFLDARKQNRKTTYVFRENPNFTAATDMHTSPDKPLMVIFEDHHCASCDQFQDDLKHLKIAPLLKQFTVVRLDASANTPIVTPAGATTTAQAWVRDLKLDYRPGVVLFDAGEEIMRIDNMLRLWHLGLALNYVGARHYLQYAAVHDYGRVLREKTLSAGINIDYWE